MKQILQSFKTGEMWLAEVPAPLCKARGVVVKTAASFVSAGTERMLAEFAKKGLVGKALQMPDQVKKVLRKMKTEGVWATIEKVQAKLDQPIPLGYSSAGVVVEAGRDCGDLKVGDRVACGGAGFANHAEYAYVPRNLMVKIPDGVSFADASCATVGSIALQGVRQCEVRLGETVAVIGLGLLGQLAVQMLRASGCRVIGYDLNKGRCELAMQCDPSNQTISNQTIKQSNNSSIRCVSENLVAEAMAFSGGMGVDAVLITAATHSDEPVTVAAEICRKKGRVVATGLVGMNLPRDQYYKKEVDFRLSCSYGPGRYDPVYEEQGVDYPVGYVRWTEQRNMAAFLQLVAEGKVTPSKLVTHTFKFDDALEAYEVLLGIKKEPYLGIVLDYSSDGLMSGLSDCLIDRRVNIAPSANQTIANPKSNNSPVGISFIGAGNFAKAVLLPNLKSNNRKSDNQTISFRGVSTATGMSAADTAKKYGFAFAATDQNEVLKDAETDLVFVTTRHDMHAAQVKACLEAGKYVFTEKPLVISEEQFVGLLDCLIDGKRESKSGDCSIGEGENKSNNIKSNNQTILSRIMVGFNRRFSPHAKLLREYFARRSLPLVMHYRVNAGSIPREVWLQDPSVGGGRMVGEGCHFIDFMSYVCGAPVVKVQAMCIQTANAAETPEDSISVNLQFADGSVGTLEYVALGDVTLPKEVCEIHGEGSTATMDNFCKTVCSGKLGKRKLKGKQQKGFAEELAATIEAVRRGSAMPISWDEIENVTRTTFAVLKSVKSGETVLVQ